MIRCCVFDLDGTLLNTTYALQRSMNLTLAEFGFGEISLAQVKQYVGNGSLNYCRRALDYFGADKEALLEPVSRRYAELFQQHCGYRVEPYEGMREALAFLSSRGAKLAVLSNKPQSRTEDNIYG
ncbi:MAG: HAD hydrolase-like protein, partial [Stomatobaculum sp.]|nr:HAD hydrolase-like protein [Stomatobaculum sp.]